MRNGMSYSEAGRIGAIKTNIKQSENKLKKIEEYNKNPKLCKKCKTPLSYNKKKNYFCSRSCSASINNRGVRRHGNPTITLCVKCGQETMNKKYCSRKCSLGDFNDGCKIGIGNQKCLNCGIGTKWSKYCSHKCQIEYSWKIKKNKIIEQNNVKINPIFNSKIAKKFLKETIGEKCQVCGIEKWNEQKVPLVLDHINGNSEDWSLENLRLICGNCDMQTSTYKGKNKGKGRYFRRLRYKNGQSY